MDPKFRSKILDCLRDYRSRRGKDHFELSRRRLCEISSLTIYKRCLSGMAATSPAPRMPQGKIDEHSGNFFGSMAFCCRRRVDLTARCLRIFFGFKLKL